MRFEDEDEDGRAGTWRQPERSSKGWVSDGARAGSSYFSAYQAPRRIPRRRTLNILSISIASEPFRAGLEQRRRCPRRDGGRLLTVKGVLGRASRAHPQPRPSDLPPFPSHTLFCDNLMDTSGYDLQAWTAYYESQGYDSATSASYAYYALQQAQAAAVSATASTSASAYGVRPCLFFPSVEGLAWLTSCCYWTSLPQYTAPSSYAPAPSGLFDGEPTLGGAGGQPAQEGGGGKVKGKRTTVIRKGGGKMWDE